jgi:hypothetical protein
MEGACGRSSDGGGAVSDRHYTPKIEKLHNQGIIRRWILRLQIIGCASIELNENCICSGRETRSWSTPIRADYSDL